MTKRNIEAIYPLSPQQQGMLLESAAAGEAGLHVEQLSCVLEGRLDPEAFERTWRRLLDRHALLRTGFVWKDQEKPLQVVFRDVDVSVVHHDLRGHTASTQEERLRQVQDEDRSRSFHLARAPLMRVALLRTDEHRWHLVWTHHHLLMDGWCRPLLLGEMFELYRALCTGVEPVLAPAPRSYKDYVTWLQNREDSGARSFWTRELAGVTRPTLPGRPWTEADGFDSKGFSEHRVTLSGEETGALETLARGLHVTLNTVIQGAWARLLMRYGDSQDVVFGITHAGRPEELTGIERTVGLFISTIPLRVRLEGNPTVRDWLRDLQLRNSKLRDHGYVSAGQVHGWSEVPGRLPLFESLVVFENYPVDPRGLSRFSNDVLRVRDVQAAGAGTRHPVTLLAVPGDRLELVVVADRQRLRSADARRIAEHLRELLSQVGADQGQRVGSLGRTVADAEVPVVRVTASESRPSAADEAPATPTEQAVAALWREILDVESVHRDDSFLELGGHSLLATRLAARLRETFRIELPLRWLFEAPTVAELAARIDQAFHATGDSGAVDEPVIPKVSDDPDGEFPLSFAQRQLWFLQQLEPDNPFYNHTAGVRLDGPLHVAALDGAIREVVRRHQILRTVYAETGDQPVQVVRPTPDRLLPRVDLHRLAPDAADRELRSLAHQDVRRPVDLRRGPVVRFYLLRREAREHVVFLTTHHIASDAWSEGILIRELSRLYEAFAQGSPSPLPEPALQYLDFAHWQQEHFRGEALEQELSFWRRHLGRGLTPVRLPSDRVRSGDPSHEGDRAKHVLSRELGRRLRAFDRERGSTLFMTLLTAFGVLLYRATGQKNLLLGTVAANRGHRETEHLIGCFINALPMRLDLSGNPRFEELLSAVRNDSLEVFAHQDLPIELLMQELEPSRSVAGAPTPFRVTFGVRNVPSVDLEARGLVFETLDIEETSARLDLTLWVHERGEDIEVFWRYSTDLFDASTITRLQRRWESLLASALAEPATRIDALEMRTESERREEQEQDEEWKQAQAAKLMRGRRRKKVETAIES